MKQTLKMQWLCIKEAVNVFINRERLIKFLFDYSADLNEENKRLKKNLKRKDQQVEDLRKNLERKVLNANTKN